jgi:hypothetical protein
MFLIVVKFRPMLQARLMLAATLFAAVVQLCWPLALAMHVRLAHHQPSTQEYDLPVEALHDLASAHDENHASHEPSHDHADCPTCQSIAQLSVMDLPAPLLPIDITTDVHSATIPASQCALADPSLPIAAPRAPPAA